MKAITISRQYGSGGGEIGARLATRLNWRLIDHELVAQVAQQLGITQQTAQARDEYTQGFIARLLSRQSVYQLAPPVEYAAELTPHLTEEHRYQETLRHVVETAAESGQVVIIGRASQVILARRPDVLHVRVVAPLQARVAYVALREGLDEASARARVQLKDHDRSRYLQTVYHHQVDDPMLYDLVINTGVLSLDKTVELICQALSGKAETLSLPAEEMGPARGLARYAGRPSDIRPPARLTKTEPSSS
jgi:cytidylate kinase